jgi:anti-sigma B factor antagonist
MFMASSSETREDRQFLVWESTREGAAMVDLFSVTSRDIKGGRVFAFKGELDISTTDGLVEQITGPAGSFIVIDLSELTFTDSSGLGAILTARWKIIRDGGTLVLSRPKRNVQALLEVTGLDELVTDWDPEWEKPSAADPLPESDEPALIAEDRQGHKHGTTHRFGERRHPGADYSQTTHGRAGHTPSL